MGFVIKNGVLVEYEEEKSVTEVVIPKGVAVIGDRAFYGCINLTTVTIPDSVTSIGFDAFSETALVKNQDGLKYVDMWCVGSDNDIIEVMIQMGTIGIADHAFSYCRRLESITLPEGVRFIGDYAFADSFDPLIVYQETSVTIPDSVTHIGFNAFVECSSVLIRGFRLSGRLGIGYDELNMICQKITL